MERYLILILCGTFGGLIANRLHIPGGAVVGAMLFSGLASISFSSSVQLSPGFTLTVQIFLGTSLGMTFDRSVLPLLTKAMPLAICSTLVLLLVTIVMAFIAHRMGLVDFGTALFGFSPGGMSGMAILAQSEGHKTPIVAFLHLVRIFTLFLTVPLLVRLFTLLKQHT